MANQVFLFGGSFVIGYAWSLGAAVAAPRFGHKSALVLACMLVAVLAFFTLGGFLAHRSLPFALATIAGAFVAVRDLRGHP